MHKIFSEILFDLEKVKGVKMIALAGRDGFLIGDYESDEIETLTMMSAVLLRAAEAATNKLEKVSPDRVIVDYEGGKLITATVGQKALISVMAAQDAALEPIFSELERTVGRIKEIL
ncbi:MAG: roadblock/LC7 domain-containing protein [Candidatus Methanoperedens sp.]|nr:roadblock/LC7 domain-containing protein [Candidatus Methanoperedens sp.]MCZ7371095.1 roadblock/LC7 domain-containing protein [Candidatus Methanoperedens sp.]